MIGVVLPADTSIAPRTVEWEREALLLPLLYREIGCDSVDSFRVRQPFADLTVWVDDEGLLAAEPEYNGRLLLLANSLGYGAEALAGTAFITGPPDEAGDMTGLPEGTVAGLLAFVNQSWKGFALMHEAAREREAGR